MVKDPLDKDEVGRYTTPTEDVLRTIKQTKPEEVIELKVRPLDVITALATVGTFLTARKILKINKTSYNAWVDVIKAKDEQMLWAQKVIGELREAGKDFSFYPGVGIYVNR